MRWHTTAFFVEHMTSVELIADFPSSFLLTGQVFQAEEALSLALPSPFAVGEVGGWTILCDPLCIITWREPMLAEFSRGRRIFSFVIEHASRAYGFWYFVDGYLVRHVLFQEGECVEEEGVYLPEERDQAVKVWYCDEYTIIRVLEAVTGLKYEQMNTVLFQGLENDLYVSRLT